MEGLWVLNVFVLEFEAVEYYLGSSNSLFRNHVILFQHCCTKNLRYKSFRVTSFLFLAARG